MTEYIFTSDDGVEWTEEEKQLCIKRHEEQQKRFRARWDVKVWQTVGNALFHKESEKEMNANELADELGICACVYYDSTTNQYFEDVELSSKIADMLRQQAKEIIELNKIIQAFRAGRESKPSFAFGFEAPIRTEHYE